MVLAGVEVAVGQAVVRDDPVLAGAHPDPQPVSLPLLPAQLQGLVHAVGQKAQGEVGLILPALPVLLLKDHGAVLSPGHLHSREPSVRPVLRPPVHRIHPGGNAQCPADGDKEDLLGQGAGVFHRQGPHRPGDDLAVFDGLVKPDLPTDIAPDLHGVRPEGGLLLLGEGLQDEPPAQAQGLVEHPGADDAGVVQLLRSLVLPAARQGLPQHLRVHVPPVLGGQGQQQGLLLLGLELPVLQEGQQPVQVPPALEEEIKDLPAVAVLLYHSLCPIPVEHGLRPLLPYLVGGGGLFQAQGLLLLRGAGGADNLILRRGGHKVLPLAGDRALPLQNDLHPVRVRGVNHPLAEEVPLLHVDVDAAQAAGEAHRAAGPGDHDGGGEDIAVVEDPEGDLGPLHRRAGGVLHRHGEGLGCGVEL